MSAAQCVLQALLISSSNDCESITSNSHKGIMSLLVATAVDRNRLDLLPNDTRNLLLNWISVQEGENVV